MKLGEYVKNYRAQERMSVRSFAAISGLSAGYISMLENNRNPKTGEPITPSIDTYKAVAKATGISVGDLVASVSDDIDISGSRDNIQIPSGAMAAFMAAFLSMKIVKTAKPISVIIAVFWILNIVFMFVFHLFTWSELFRSLFGIGASCFCFSIGDDKCI